MSIFNVVVESVFPEVGKYLSDGVRTAARALGAARYISMDHFDSTVFLREIEWLIPESKVGSYYEGDHSSDGHGDNDHDGHDSKSRSPTKKIS